MFPYPPSHSEIEHVLKPLLEHCDKVGRAYIVQLVKARDVMIDDYVPLSPAEVASQERVFWDAVNESVKRR